MSGHAIFKVPEPYNEPVRSYAPGTPEREELRVRLAELESKQMELPLVIGGEEVRTGETFEAVEPHNRSHVLATVHKGGAKEVERAIAASATAWEDWSRRPWEERATILLRAAELLSGPWRSTLKAATMLGQSKTAHQAEIDSACELIDFWRFNVKYMTRIYEEQPISSPGVWNRLDYRPLEGFVFAVTPFNFTAIAGNLPSAPALMGNTVVWKPSATAKLSAHVIMQILREAGLPDGVINLAYGDPAQVADTALGEAKGAAGVKVIAGGGADKSKGWFVQPSLLEVEDVRSRFMTEEFFGPIVSAVVYDDARWDETLALIDATSLYGLTGAVFSR